MLIVTDEQYKKALLLIEKYHKGYSNLTDDEIADALFIQKEYEEYHYSWNKNRINEWQICPLCNGKSEKTHMYVCEVCFGEKLFQKAPDYPPQEI